MSKALITEGILSAIANAIRGKLNVETSYKPTEMAAAIQSIDGYPEPTGTVSITQNGTAKVKDYASANVQVPNSYTSADEGMVVSSGALVAQTARAEALVQNGTYDTTLNNSVTVNMQGVNVYNPFTHYKDYIRSSGTQYIDTGYKLPSDQSDIIIEIVCNFNMGGGLDASIFGVDEVFLSFRGNNGENFYVMSWKSAQGTNVYRRSNNGRGVKTHVVVNKDGYSIFKSPTILAENQTGNNFGNNSEDRSIYLFCINHGNQISSNTIGAFDLYNFRIITSNGVALDLVPAIDSNNVVCLKDKISGNYLYNAGSGDFVFGTDQ